MEVFAVPGLPEVRPGDDLAGLIDARVDLRPDDVVLVASTIVSKAEGRSADLSAFPAGERAREVAARIEAIADEPKDPRFAQAVLDESEELLIEAPILLAVTRFGDELLDPLRDGPADGDHVQREDRQKDSVVAIVCGAKEADDQWRREESNDGRENPSAEDGEEPAEQFVRALHCLHSWAIGPRTPRWPG
jgi:hypothetical protein